MLRIQAASLLLLLGVSASAETTYTAKKIVFQNPGPFTQQQLETASGMHAGSPLNADTLTAAAQKLSDTGYFLDIGAHLNGSATNTSAVFVLKPAPMEALLPVGFENFVWLTHDEVEKAITAKFPLFIDRLQENSAIADDIAAVLRETLAAKGVTAEVEHETVEPTLYHPLRALEFRVSKPAPVLASLRLLGVGTEFAPLIQKSAKLAAQSRYNDGLAGLVTSELMLGPMLDAGYVKAKLSEVTLEAEPSSSTTPVVFSARLFTGDVYHVSGLQFAATDVVSQDAFNAGVKLHAGDVASREKLLETLSPVDTAYRKLGYADVIIKAEPTFDEAAHTVSYAVSVVPGEQYRIHDVQMNGLDAVAQAEVTANFTQKPGEIFDPIYIRNFLGKNASLKALARYAGGYKAYADPNTHTVDVVINFFPVGSMLQ